MKIIKVKHWTEHLALTRPYTIAYRTISDVEIHFVRLDTDSGTYGLGAASPGMSVTGEGIDDCRNALDDHLEALLVGADLRHIRALTRRLSDRLADAPGARAAADMALYDLAGKSLNLPLADLLGRAHRSLPTSITLGIQSVEESLADAREYLGRGFRILKVKIGHSMEEDVERLHKIREAVGPHIAIRVDANQGYSADTFFTFWQRIADLDLEFAEQPLPADAVAEMTDLPRDIRKKTAGDESLVNVADALRFTCPPCPFGIYNIKLMKCGGITSGLEIAEIAKLAKFDVMWGCNDESIVSIAAALHAALASEATAYLDLDGSFDLARDLAQGGFHLENGELSVTDKPGLGVELI